MDDAPRPKTVLVVDDHPVVALGIDHFIRSTRGLALLGIVTDPTDPNRQDALDAGADAYLTKDHDLRDLVELITSEGIERAKAEGRYAGGKQRIDREKVLARKAAGQSVAAIATGLKCSRMQVYRVLANGA